VCITLPPLRQRRDEIPELTRIFLKQYSEHYNKAMPVLSEDTLRLLAEHHWPGNVRELENLMKRAVILGCDESIRRELADAIAGRTFRAGPIPALQARTPAVLPPAASAAVNGHTANGNGHAPPPTGQDAAAPPVHGSLKDIGRQAARGAERELIYRTLQQTRWNRREAAEILGISYKALLYKIKEAELDRAS
jgi:two-component system, NtrC family, response regulator AtoC